MLGFWSSLLARGAEQPRIDIVMALKLAKGSAFGREEDLGDGHFSNDRDRMNTACVASNNCGSLPE